MGNRFFIPSIFFPKKHNYFVNVDKIELKDEESLEYVNNFFKTKNNLNRFFKKK